MQGPTQPPFKATQAAPPTPWLATSSRPQRNQELQDPGRSRGLFASLGRSGTRACHTSKAEGAARALQRRRSAQGPGSLRRKGVHATAGGHLRKGLSSHHQGAELRQAGLVSGSPCTHSSFLEAVVRGGYLSLGTRFGGQGRGPDGARSSYSLHRRGCVSMGMNVPLRMSVAATWERCVHTWVSAAQSRRGPHPRPLPTRWGRLPLG